MHEHDTARFQVCRSRETIRFIARLRNDFCWRHASSRHQFDFLFCDLPMNLLSRSTTKIPPMKKPRGAKIVV
jgi:hypothetical protein